MPLIVFHACLSRSFHSSLMGVSASHNCILLYPTFCVKYIIPLQVLYFGHLRKIGGRGSYGLVHTTYLYPRKPHGSKSNHSRTGHPTKDVHPEPAEGIFSCSSVPLAHSRAISKRSARHSPNSNDSPTYAKTGGWGVFSGPTFKHHLKCRRADIPSLTVRKRIARDIQNLYCEVRS
jgi:hypothetical protein